MFAVRRLSVTV